MQTETIRFPAYSTRFLWLIVLFIFLIFIDISLGAVKIPFADLLKVLIGNSDATQNWGMIIWEFRIPKLITAILAGAALSVSGLQMQTIFRNPLAGPDVLGINSGASLGVALLVMGFTKYFSINFYEILGSWAITLAAWGGAASILFVILALSLRIKDVMTILILGILFGSATLAVVNIMQYYSSESLLKAFIIWTMGSLGGVTKSQLWVLVPSIIFGLFISLISSKTLNVFLLGENSAKTLGVNIRQWRIVIFTSTSILAGSITAFCGPIAFVGIAVPHICRMYFKTANHLILTPAVILVGAEVLLVSDIISQLLGRVNPLPINSITAILGIPIIVWIILKNYKLNQ